MAAVLSTSALVLSSSDSESDNEDLVFTIDAFKKYEKPSKSEAFCTNVRRNKSFQLSSSLNPGPSSFKKPYVNVNPEKERTEDRLKRQKSIMKKELEENLKKSIVHQAGFEKMERQPSFLSRRQISKQRLKEKDKTKGFQWFNMPAAEMTEEKKNDLLLLQMRQALDPKRFYKRSINKTLPKYFQIGTIVECPAEYYSARIPKKERKQTLVDELLADAEFRQYQKRKVAEAMRLQPAKYHKQQRAGKRNKVVEARFTDAKKKQKKMKRR